MTIEEEKALLDALGEDARRLRWASLIFVVAMVMQAYTYIATSVSLNRMRSMRNEMVNVSPVDAGTRAGDPFTQIGTVRDSATGFFISTLNVPAGVLMDVVTLMYKADAMPWVFCQASFNGCATSTSVTRLRTSAFHGTNCK